MKKQLAIGIVLAFLIIALVIALIQLTPISPIAPIQPPPTSPDYTNTTNTNTTNTNKSITPIQPPPNGLGRTTFHAYRGNSGGVAIWPKGGTITVAFEDGPPASTDWDYNDWVATIDTLATFQGATADPDLVSMHFTIIPEARGADYNHVFHMKFLAGTFKSDGRYTLTVLDASNTPVSGYPMTGTFNASIDNDFIVIPDTVQALRGVYTNTIEPTGIVSHYPNITNTDPNAPQHQPYVTSQRKATLTIEFDTLEPFNFSTYDPYTDFHGEGLFFDPYLHVVGSGDNIQTGDSRMLTVPVDWMWPEAGVSIWLAYTTGVTQANPPAFSSNWWINYNDLVYNGKP